MIYFAINKAIIKKRISRERNGKYKFVDKNSNSIRRVVRKTEKQIFKLGNLQKRSLFGSICTLLPPTSVSRYVWVQDRVMSLDGGSISCLITSGGGKPQQGKREGRKGEERKRAILEMGLIEADWEISGPPSKQSVCRHAKCLGLSRVSLAFFVFFFL